MRATSRSGSDVERRHQDARLHRRGVADPARHVRGRVLDGARAEQSARADVGEVRADRAGRARCPAMV